MDLTWQNYANSLVFTYRFKWFLVLSVSNRSIHSIFSHSLVFLSKIKLLPLRLWKWVEEENVRKFYVHRSLGPDEMQPRVPVELDDITVRSWWLVATPNDWKKQMIHPSSLQARRRTWGSLQVGHFNPSLQKDCRVSHPSSHFQTQEGQKRKKKKLGPIVTDLLTSSHAWASYYLLWLNDYFSG